MPQPDGGAADPSPGPRGQAVHPVAAGRRREREGRGAQGYAGGGAEWRAEGALLDLLGLDDITAALYRLWLRDESLSVEGAAAALRQPVAVVTRSRDRLVALSLLVALPNRPGRLVAAHPEGPLAQLIQSQHEQLIRRHEHLVRAQAQVSALVSEFRASRQETPGGGGLDRVASSAAVRTELVGMVGAAQREVVSVRTRATLAELAADLLPLELAALRRGVRIRAVIARPRAGLAWSTAVEHLAEVVAAGAEIRLADDPAVDLTIVDDRVGVVRLIGGTGGAGAAGPGGPGPAGAAPGADLAAMVVRGTDLAGLATALFEQLWENADRFGAPAGPAGTPGATRTSGPGGAGGLGLGQESGELALAGARPAAGVMSGQLGDPRGVPGQAGHGGQDDSDWSDEPGEEPDGRLGDRSGDADADAPPSPAELLLLQLLADGAKDESAARSLGVSVRTVRRMVADLMRRLEARSRFQAGILAKRRGWL
nr:LuxR C-terminal-related transcriptional regulator [Pseudofrankia sp. EUN1h]